MYIIDKKDGDELLRGILGKETIGMARCYSKKYWKD